MAEHGKGGLESPMTTKESKFLETYKTEWNECGQENETLRRCAEKLGLAYKTVEAYRYRRLRVRAEIDLWKRKKTMQGDGTRDEVISVKWITEKLQMLFELLERDPKGKVGDMTGILNSMVNILSKFNNQFAGELEHVKNMPTSALIEKFAEVSGKIFGNKRSAAILGRLMTKANGGKDHARIVAEIKDGFREIPRGTEAEENAEPEAEDVPVVQRVDDGSPEQERPDESRVEEDARPAGAVQ